LDLDGASLADEARMPEAASRATAPVDPGAAAAAARVRAARRRFLPYVVAGGAVVGAYMNIVAAGRDQLGVVFGVGISAGIGVGMALGWPLLGWYEGRAARVGIHGGRQNLMIALLTVPPYVAAAWGAALAGWVTVKVVAHPVPDSGPPNAWPLLIGAAAVLYPINYAFARRDTGRPDDFAGAVTSMTTEIHDTPKSFGVVAEFLVGLAWFTGTLFALFAVALAINAVFAAQLAGLAIPSLAVYPLLAIWIGISAAGTVWTIRRMDRRRARRQPRR
jgi:hypothetical protein